MHGIEVFYLNTQNHSKYLNENNAMKNKITCGKKISQSDDQHTVASKITFDTIFLTALPKQGEISVISL